MTGGRPSASPTIERTFRLLPGLKAHTPDLAVGLASISDPRVLKAFIGRFRTIVDRGADAPKVKLRLAPDLDRKLQDLAQELSGVLRPELAVYEMVNAALLAVRCNRLASTYTKRLRLPDERQQR